MLLDLGAEADVVDALGNTSLHVGHNITVPPPPPIALNSKPGIKTKYASAYGHLKVRDDPNFFPNEILSLICYLGHPIPR